jgi:regulatory protein
MPPETARAAATGEVSGLAGPQRGASAEGPAEERLQSARLVAWRELDRRDHTAAELRGKLERKAVEPWVAERVLEELVEQRYVDDAAYARRFAEDRRRLDAWGAERIERRLRELGVGREHIEAALAEHGMGAELEAAVALLEQRFPVAPETRRDRDRALGMLVRKGYALELASDALRRHGGADEPD